jgi:hypothetical protein
VPSVPRRRATTAGLSILLFAALAGCSALGGAEEAPRESPGGAVTEAADADVFSIAVGDCLNVAALEETTETETVPVVPCNEPHDGEVYGELVLEDGDYPGVTAVQEQADEYCAAQFETFVGIAYDDSIYYQWSLTPTQESWDSLEDRKVQCVLDTDGEQVTASLKGAKK